jgi:membrane fusion protein
VAENGLFRANAVKQQSARLDGDVIIAQPVSSSFLTIVLLCVVTAIIAFLSLTSFNRKETRYWPGQSCIIPRRCYSTSLC